jgi:integrase
MLCGLRRVLKEAWRLDLMNVDAYHRAADVKNVSYQHEPSGRTLSDGEIAALLAQCEPTDVMDMRDAAIIALFFACGLRIAELQALNVADYDQSQATLRIMGKGLRERIVYIPPLTEQRLQAWITVRGLELGPLFIAIGRWKQSIHEYRRLSIRALFDMLQRRGHRAGLAPFTPHDLRRTNVTNLLAKGVDVITVSRCVGHQSPQSTLRYDQRDEQIKQQVVMLRQLD